MEKLNRESIEAFFFFPDGGGFVVLVRDLWFCTTNHGDFWVPSWGFHQKNHGITGFHPVER